MYLLENKLLVGGVISTQVDRAVRAGPQLFQDREVALVVFIIVRTLHSLQQ